MVKRAYYIWNYLKREGINELASAWKRYWSSPFFHSRFSSPIPSDHYLFFLFFASPTAWIAPKVPSLLVVRYRLWKHMTIFPFHSYTPPPAVWLLSKYSTCLAARHKQRGPGTDTWPCLYVCTTKTHAVKLRQFKIQLLCTYASFRPPPAMHGTWSAHNGIVRQCRMAAPRASQRGRALPSLLLPASRLPCTFVQKRWKLPYGGEWKVWGQLSCRARFLVRIFFFSLSTLPREYIEDAPQVPLRGVTIGHGSYYG